MKKLIKPASLLLYLLSLLAFFFAGVYYAVITEAAKDQGLAGGAIVLGYGVMFGFFAFVIALFVAYYATHKTIVIANRILAIIVVIFITVSVYRHMTNQKETTVRYEESRPKLQFRFTTSFAYLPVDSAFNHPAQDTDTPMGLGFFKPDFFNFSVFYFYGNPNLQKSVQEHTPTDSIVFKRLEYGFDIQYAPPWLVPDHLKLDYDMFYFRVQSVGQDFVEVVVNTHTQTTAYVNRYAGETIYWPDFLLNINSVEFIDAEAQPVRIKPLLHAGEVNTSYDFMRPLLIQNDWMFVELQNDNFQSVDKGWIQWKKDGKLLITYSLLS